MNRITPLLTAIAVALLAPLAQAELDPRLRSCHATFTQCMDGVPEQGPDGRYPIAMEQACEVSYERCKVGAGFAPNAGTPGGGAEMSGLPDHDE